MKIKRVPYSSIVDKLSTANRDYIQFCFGKFNFISGSNSEFDFKDYKAISELVKGLPYDDEIMDLMFNSCEGHKDLTADLTALVEKFVQSMTLGQTIKYIRRVMLNSHTQTIYLVPLYMFFMIVLEMYGGVLVAIDSAEEVALFATDLPTPAGVNLLFCFTESDLKNLLSSIPDVVFAKHTKASLSAVKRLRRAIKTVSRNCMSAYSTITDSAKTVRDKVSDWDKNVLTMLVGDVNKFCGLHRVFYTLGLTYVFRDIRRCENSETSHIFEMMLDKNAYINHCNYYLTKSYEHIYESGCLKRDAFYNREFYAKDSGIGFTLHPAYTDDTKFFRANDFFVREEHNEEEHSHLLLIDIKCVGLMYFIVIDMTDISNFAFNGIFSFHIEALLKIAKWLGVYDKMFTLSEESDRKRLVELFLKNNREDPNVETVSEEDAWEWLCYFEELYSEISNMVTEESIVYRKPVHWNYESNSGLAPNKHSTESTKTFVKVGSYTRKLPYGFQASEEAKALAEKYFISLEDGKTFVSEFERKTRGKSKSRNELNQLKFD